MVLGAAVANNKPKCDEIDGKHSRNARRAPCPPLPPLLQAAPRAPAAVDKSETVEVDESLQGEYTWTIENFIKLKQVKLYSPVFQSGQYNWCAQPQWR